jgi:hypothetical protein
MAITIPIITDFNARGLKDAETKIDKFAKSAGRGLKNLGKAAAIGAAAFGAGIAVFGKKAIEAGEAAATSNARIAQINESMGLFGDSTKKVTDRLIKYAEATARSTGVDQNQIKLTQAKLLTFNKLARSAGKLGGSFDRATKAAVNMASAGFGSAENNAVQLGKALNDPIKGVTALTKSGITFTAQEKEKIKTLVESNRMLEAQELVLKAIETQVGGTAEATANDTDKMKVAFSQVSERVGIALLPILSKLTSFLIDTLIPAAEKVVKIFNKEGLGGVLRRLGDFIQDAIPPALTALGNFLQTVGSWIVNTGAPLLVEKIGVLKDRLTSWIKESGPQALSNLGAFMGDMIKWILNDGIPLLIKATAKLSIALLKWLVDIGPSLIRGIASFTGQLALSLVESLVQALSTLGSRSVAIGKAFANGIIDIINTQVIGRINSLLEFKVGPIKVNPPDIKNIPRLAAGGIVSSPTLALIGEAGPEAVVPLSGSNRPNMGNNVTINVHGGDPNAVVAALRTYMRQNGSIPIRTSNIF